MPTSQLPTILAKIRQVFDLEQLLQTPVSQTYTIDYYTKTNFFYRRFHSKQGAMHFPLYWNDAIKSHELGLQQQALLVKQQIEAIGARHIVELGSGQGYNSRLLANQKSSLQFTGIDLTPLHVQQANDKAAALPNLHFEQGNFEALSFASQSFDLAFGVETLCHAHDSRKVFAEAHRVLKSGSRLIVFDGFHVKKDRDMNAAEQQAVELLALAFAVQQFKELETWTQQAEAAHFKILTKTDFSQAILPNLTNLKGGASRFFDYPKLIKIATKIGLLPRVYAIHVIAGMLAAVLIEEGVIGYFEVVLEKE